MTLIMKKDGYYKNNDKFIYFAFINLKESRNIYILFYLRKLFQLRGQFCSTALVIDTLYVKYWSVNI